MKEVAQEAYRDKLATVDSKGKRIWIYPKKPKGKYYDIRKYVSYFLFLILFGMPFIKMNGVPFMQFNIPKSEFIIFGIYFPPQDFHLFVIAMLIGMVFIVLFTVIYGRLFCGWICPQTIFMEMVFRRIEYWIEGDYKSQIKLNKGPMSSNGKIRKKVLKHTIFILISAFIAHTFLSYIIGVDALWDIITSPVQEHWKGFAAMVIFTGMFYGVFAFMREQVCTTICPYGRLQGVLLDENSLAVSYDFVRGEPRGHLIKPRKGKKSDCKDGCSTCKKNDSNCPADLLKAELDKINTIEPVKGDCIDCDLCVKVCPTGIDIRNGTQLECVNCTACMDACDEVMIKIKKPTGLIRIDSYNAITKGVRSLWNSRVAAYSLVLVLLIGLESFLFISRSSIETLLLRTPGMLYQEDKGVISNLYNYQLINKSNLESEVQFKIKNFDAAVIEFVGQAPITQSNKISEGALFIKIDGQELKSRKTTLTVEVFADGKLIDETKTSFIGPRK
ncbi:MAG: 4Fe-4S binding protein [Saprospiraceae bacterium]|nr:4Fe-4S binding protein [Bacteroidia bacterium]NNL93919.1 4Fe-4S binding protein [Saprospiraceae bacterium]